VGERGFGAEFRVERAERLDQLGDPGLECCDLAKVDVHIEGELVLDVGEGDEVVAHGTVELHEVFVFVSMSIGTGVGTGAPRQDTYVD
jgi:hypothetical protein